MTARRPRLFGLLFARDRLQSGARGAARRRALRLARLWAVVFALWAVLAPATPASAHASLLSSVPADGDIALKPPGSLRLDFNEPVSPLVMRLVRPDGRIATLTGVTATDNSVIIAAPDMLEQGTYVLSWRVISADGHPVGGVISFSLGHPTSSVTAPLVEGAAALHAVLWAAQLSLFIGLFLGVGGAAFAAWLAAQWPMPGQRLFALLMVAGVVAAIVSLPLQGLDALGDPLRQVWRPAVWRQGFVTSWGWTVVIALATLGTGLFALTRARRKLAQVLALLGLAGIGLAFAASGHASTTAPRLLTAPAVFVHAVCIALWIGSLLPLAITVRTGDRIALERFSRMIPAPLLLLIATGIVLTSVELDRPDALWTTAYGLVLSAKLALVFLLLALAVLNRYVLVPRLTAKRTQHLLAVIGMEFALALVILGVVGLWRFTTPPRALAAAETTYIHFHVEPAMADIELKPERDRGASVSIAVTDSDLRPVAAKEVTLVIWNPTAGIEPIRSAATFSGGALWVIRGLRIPIAGVWRMRVEILISDFDKVMIEDNVELPRAP